MKLQRRSHRWLPPDSLKRWVSCFLVGVSLCLAIASCSASDRTSGQGATLAAVPDEVELTILSYSATRAAYEEIIPQFVAKWKQEHQQTIQFNRSYGASGTQTRHVIDGLEADIVHLALALDTQKIQQAGLLEPGWEEDAPNQAIVTRSVGAIVTRQGNPKGIETWADLGKPNLSVVTANPKTSGGARWNFLALWGSVVKTGGDPTQAFEFTRRVYKNAPALPRDAREASDAFFKQGQGDALINYENEVILAAQNGLKLPYLIPEINISIDSPVAVVDKNVDKHGTRDVAEAFVQFLFTPEAQREFAKVGFRPVESTVAAEFANRYPPIKTLFTVQDLGGWDEVQPQFFANGAAFDKIQSSLSQ